MDIPVYLVAGFLDGGKTNFINGILEDGFAKEERTLLICCEEGEEEYDPRFLDNVTVITIDEEEDLKCSYMKELEKKYKPQQIIFEYNGMWKLDRLYQEVLPANWVLYQIMTFVQASTFEPYAKNMGQIMMEKIMNADLLVFNRCTSELAAALRSRNLRMVNRRADIYLEFEDGTNEDYANDDTPPFDMSQEIINIPDEDYGVWFVDAMDHPERYNGRLLRMKLIMCHSKQYPGVDCPGRFAMVCCEDDIQFLALIAHGPDLDKYKNHQWIEVTVRMGIEEHPAYKGEGPVMNILSITPCEKIERDIVTF